jgi:chromosome segregation ATPase
MPKMSDGGEMDLAHAIEVSRKRLSKETDELAADETRLLERTGWPAAVRAHEQQIAALTERKGALSAEITGLTQQLAEVGGQVAEARATHRTETERMAGEREALLEELKALRGEKVALTDAVAELRKRFAG